MWLAALAACAILNGGANRALHAASTAASLRIAAAEAIVADAEQRIAQLEEAIRAQGRTQADKLENLDQVVTEVSRLRGEVEVLRFQVDEIRRGLDSSAMDQERRMLHAEARLRQVEGFLDLRPPAPPSDAELGIGPDGVTAEATPPSAESTQPLPDTAAARIELAAEHMAAGRNAVARALLLRTVDDMAGAPEMDLVRYRIGETWFNEGNWKSAARAFQAVSDNHGKSDWACWAQYRIGECFERMGNLDGARAFYAGATEGRCAKSSAAKEARKHL
jgi:TolA-binding protein